jgi:phospholipid/cholesterol/gamma-HCH transport system permease protein
MNSQTQGPWASVLGVWRDFFGFLWFGRLPWGETGRQFVRVVREGTGAILAGSVVQGVFVLWIAGFYSNVFGGKLWVGSVTVLAVIRELGVLMTGVLFAGRLGTAFTVEIGSMQLSEQVAALKLMGIDPIRHLGFPRVFASVVAVPLFVVLSFAVAVFSSWFFMALFWDLSWPLFFQNAFLFVTPSMVSNALLRALLVGLAVALNAVALGFFPGTGAEDLGRAATRSIVVNLFSVLLIDLGVGMLTSLANQRAAS